MSLPFITQPPLGCGDPGDPIDFSCRFEGSQYMTRLFSAGGNRQTYTESVWFKLLGKVTNPLLFLNDQGQAGTYAFNYLYADRITVGEQTNYVTLDMDVTPENRFRDFSGWTHYSKVVDTTQAVQTNRVRQWINGVEVTNFKLTTYPVLNRQGFINRNVTHYLGTFFPGSIAALSQAVEAQHIFLDGITATADAFGYFNSEGFWVPRRFAGIGQGATTYGVNGFHLDYSDSSNLGADISGNGNNWSGVGFNAGHQSTDTPTHNENRINVVGGRQTTVTNVGLDFTYPAAYTSCRTTFPVPETYSEDVEVEIENRQTIDSNHIMHIGLMSDDFTNPNQALGQTQAFSGVIALAIGNGYKATSETANLVNVGSPSSFPVGTRVSVLWRRSDNTVRFSLDGTEIVTTPMTISGAARPFVGGFDVTLRVNSLEINDLNALPCPNPINPDSYFTVRDVDGSTTHSVHDLPWSPNISKTLIVSKRTNTNDDWVITDTVNGAGSFVSTNDSQSRTDFTSDVGNGLAAFTNVGYTTGNSVNFAGERVDLAWRATPAAGFDIMRVTHTNGTPSVVTHAADGPVEYAWVIPDAAGDRRVFHKNLAAGQYLRLNSDAAATTDAGWFTVSGNTVTLDGSLPSGDYTLYLWRGVSQFSNFTGYTGVLNSDGAFIPTDFAPRLLMQKSIATASTRWLTWIKDLIGVNPVDRTMSLEAAQALGGAGDDVDFVSNGVKFRSNSTSYNQTQDYIAAVWAAEPIRFARGQ